MITEEQAKYLTSSNGLSYFISISDKLSNYDYWVILRTLWIDKGEANLLWRKLFNANRPRRDKIMKSSDRQALRKLPDKLTVYRGCHSKKDEDKFNWTTSKDIAQKFKPYEGYIAEKEISKDEIIAYFNSRNEYEVILK